MWPLANCIVGVIEIAKAGKHSSRCSPRLHALSHHFPAHARTHARMQQTNTRTRRLLLTPLLSVHTEAQGQRALMLPGFAGERARMLSIGCHWLSKDTVTKTQPSVPRTPCSSLFLPVTYCLFTLSEPLQVRHGLYCRMSFPFFFNWPKHKNNKWTPQTEID